MSEKKIRAKRIFDLTLLNECITRDGASLIGDYNELRSTTIIKFKCKCGCESEKKFRCIADNSGAICNISCPNSKKPCIIYNNTLLSSISERDNAKIIGKYENISIASKITYICKCGKEYTKPFRTIVNRNGLICKVCTVLLQIENVKATNLLKYGTEFTFQSKIVKDKIKETNLERYGCEVPTQNKEIYDKIKATNLERYGTENTMQNEDVKLKVKKTNLERYGSECSLNNKEIQDKIKNTMMLRHGVEHNFQAGELRDKRKETFLSKYGVEHPAQNLEIQAKTERNSKKYKEYKMPSGIIKKVQGYEPFALDELVKSYTEEQLKTDRKDVPRVEYMMEEKKHFYFPDIYIPHENKIIEVKSTWTFNKKNDITMAKAKSCKDKGYCFELWVYDGKGGKQIISV